MKPIMKCGHAANAVDKNGNPCCAICAGFTPNAFIVDDSVPDLTGRKAKCSYCGKERKSNPELPFFEHKPDKEYDKFYCGCGGGVGLMNVFSLSFGKDSMATLLLAIEQGIQIDHVMYCDIRFSDEISGEHPLMAAWIPEAERILKEQFGITVEHAFSKTYLEAFYTVKKTGRFSGKIYGFSYIRGAWCNRILKLNAISKYLSQFKKQTITQFVGIAYDEPRRWERMKAKENSRKKYRSLLVEQNLTEQDAFRICEKYGLLSPLYKSNDSIFRGGCWFCPKQCSADLYSLWKNYPDYYQKLVDIENDSRIITKFKPDGNPSDYAKRFESGYVPVRKKKKATEKQISIDEYLEENK